MKNVYVAIREDGFNNSIIGQFLYGIFTTKKQAVEWLLEDGFQKGKDGKYSCGDGINKDIVFLIKEELICREKNIKNKKWETLL